MEHREIFAKALVAQLRAQDSYGVWSKIVDDDLLIKNYVKSKEELQKIPMIADVKPEQTKAIRLIYQAIAIAFEQQTGVMCTVVMEMSHEGFGRVVVIADKIVIVDKSFKDAHRFHFRNLEKLKDDGGKKLQKALEIYNKYKG